MNALTVLVRDDEAPKLASQGVRVLRDPTSAAAQGATRLFVLVAASRLGEVAARVREANRGHHLRALLVRDDIGANWITVSLADADLRSLRNIVVHTSWDVPQRVLSAWRLGAQAKLIADASLVGDTLRLRACDLTTYAVPVGRVAALRELPPAQRCNFTIHPNGAYLHWPDADVHLDLSALRAAMHPAFAEQLRSERLSHDKRFGLGVRAVRERRGLSQAAIPEVSEREVRRIETGESFPRSETLQRLAAAHGSGAEGLPG